MANKTTRDVRNFTAKSLKKLDTTTRGTPRQRAPKGFWQQVWYEVLASSPPELLEEQLQRKLRRMSPSNRERAAAVLAVVEGEERREVVLRLLAGRA